MSYRLSSPLRPVISGVIASILAIGLPDLSIAQEKKAPKPRAGAAKTPAKATSKSPGAATQYEKHLAANMKLLNVLSRYAECLSTATDATKAALALDQIENITREAITAGEEVVKLGRLSSVLEAKLGKDADLQLASQLVAEKTRSAVKAISENGEVKTILAPAIENFQAALNRIQQAADDPQGPSASPDKKPAASATAVAMPTPGSPALVPAKSEGATASTPPPPAPPQ